MLAVMTEKAGGGLRERKKLATRQALGTAAMQLAVDRGPGRAAARAVAGHALAAVGQALRERPAGESLWAAVRGAVLDVYAVASTAPDARLIAGIRLVTSSPELRGEYLKALAIMQCDLAGIITERAGGSPAADTFVARALAGAVTAVIQAATERWLFADPPVALAPVIEEALRELVAGLRDVLPPDSALSDPAHAQRENQGQSAGPSG
jgi:hypothetical protein